MSIRKFSMACAVAALCGTTLAPLPALAHHGVTGQFDLTQTFTVTGTVTRVRFVNPHSYVYFDVTNADGETEGWRCELRSGSLLKRKGWTTDLFPIGSEISVFGSPDRRDPKTCFTEKVTFEDGRTLVRYGEIGDDGSFINPEPDTNAQQDRAGREPGTDVPDLSGNWGEPVANGPPIAYGVPRPPEYVLTQAAVDQADSRTPDQNPRFQCMPTNIILDYRFDQMLNKFEQTADMLTITYGFMDVVREIHLDGEFPPAIEPSQAGYSVGKWEDGKLNVTTKGFTPGFLDHVGGRSNRSVPYSDQTVITEIFYIDDAGELIREYTIEDPVNLAEPHVAMHKAVKSDDTFIPYECDDLTVEAE